MSPISCLLSFFPDARLLGFGVDVLGKISCLRPFVTSGCELRRTSTATTIDFYQRLVPTEKTQVSCPLQAQVRVAPPRAVRPDPRRFTSPAPAPAASSRLAPLATERFTSIPLRPGTPDRVSECIPTLCRFSRGVAVVVFGGVLVSQRASQDRHCEDKPIVSGSAVGLQVACGPRCALPRLLPAFRLSLLQWHPADCC